MISKNNHLQTDMNSKSMIGSLKHSRLDHILSKIKQELHIRNFHRVLWMWKWKGYLRWNSSAEQLIEWNEIVEIV